MFELHLPLCSTAQNMNCPISTTAFTLHYKTTSHNCTTTVLQKLSVLQRYYIVCSFSTPWYYSFICQHPSHYSNVFQGETVHSGSKSFRTATCSSSVAHTPTDCMSSALLSVVLALSSALSICLSQH